MLTIKNTLTTKMHKAVEDGRGVGGRGELMHQASDNTSSVLDKLYWSVFLPLEAAASNRLLRIVCGISGCTFLTRSPSMWFNNVCKPVEGEVAYELLQHQTPPQHASYKML